MRSSGASRLCVITRLSPGVVIYAESVYHWLKPGKRTNNRAHSGLDTHSANVTTLGDKYTSSIFEVLQINSVKHKLRGRAVQELIITGICFTLAIVTIPR